MIHGDCRDILPHLEKVDLVLTDPPYGIGEAAGKNRTRGLLAPPKDYGDLAWDNEPVAQDVITAVIDNAERCIMWGGNYYSLPPTASWLVWDKRNGQTDFADCELAWSNLGCAVRKIEHLWNGMLREGSEVRYHPTQKPLKVISWCLSQAKNVKTVLDPFMGSGTTLVACKQRGLSCIGIEREEKYCEIAVKRLSQEVFDFGGDV